MASLIPYPDAIIQGIINGATVIICSLWGNAKKTSKVRIYAQEVTEREGEKLFEILEANLKKRNEPDG